MKKKVCNLCKKRFTRQWNLGRHMQDIHHISESCENHMVKQNMKGFLIQILPYLGTNSLGILKPIRLKWIPTKILRDITLL